MMSQRVTEPSKNATCIDCHAQITTANWTHFDYVQSRQGDFCQHKFGYGCIKSDVALTRRIDKVITEAGCLPSLKFGVLIRGILKTSWNNQPSSVFTHVECFHSRHKPQLVHGTTTSRFVLKPTSTRPSVEGIRGHLAKHGVKVEGLHAEDIFRKYGFLIEPDSNVPNKLNIVWDKIEKSECIACGTEVNAHNFNEFSGYYDAETNFNFVQHSPKYYCTGAPNSSFNSSDVGSSPREPQRKKTGIRQFTFNSCLMAKLETANKKDMSSEYDHVVCCHPMHAGNVLKKFINPSAEAVRNHLRRMHAVNSGKLLFSDLVEKHGFRLEQNLENTRILDILWKE